MIIDKNDKDSHIKVSEVLKNEGVVIIPTDTVYGFSSKIGKAGDRIFKIKGRSETKPFIVLISKIEDLQKITNDEIPASLRKFWPGPLTIIVHFKDNKDTVAVRCPGSLWLRKVIEETGCPIYSTSVNRSGKPVIGSISEIISEFEEETDLIVCDGDSKSSTPSTIVLLEKDSYKVIREGAIKL